VLARRDGCPDASFREVEAPDPHPADALPPATAAWDASASARPDAAADAAVLPPQPAGGAEKLAGRALDVQVRDASCRRLDPRAAPAAGRAAEEPCTPAVARFAERSCAALEVAEQPDAPQSEPLTERSPKPPEALPRKEPVPLQAALPGVPAAR